MSGIQELPKMEITFIDGDFETIQSGKLSKTSSEDGRFNGEYIISVYGPAYKKPTGTLLIEFLEIDFTKHDSFNLFINKWGISGLAEHSATAKGVLLIEYSEKEYQKMLNDIWIECGYILEQIQEKFKNAVYYCLDINGPEWSDNLDPLQRFFLMQERNSSLFDFKEYGTNLSVQFEVEPKINAMTYKQYQNFYNTISDGNQSEAAGIIKGINFKTSETYLSPDIAAILYLEFKQMILNNKLIKLCDNCQRYFIPPRSNAKYCDRPLSEEDQRTCRTVGAVQKHMRRVDNDPLKVAYRKAYKSAHARIHSSKTIQYDERESVFRAWVDEAKARIKEVEKGEISLEQFNKWAKEG